MFRFYAKFVGKSIRWKWYFENASLISTMANAENSFKIPCIFKLTHTEHTLKRMRRQNRMEKKRSEKTKKILTYRCDISSFQSRSMCLCVVIFSASSVPFQMFFMNVIDAYLGIWFCSFA